MTKVLYWHPTVSCTPFHKVRQEQESKGGIRKGLTKCWAGADLLPKDKQPTGAFVDLLAISMQTTFISDCQVVKTPLTKEDTWWGEPIPCFFVYFNLNRSIPEYLVFICILSNQDCLTCILVVVFQNLSTPQYCSNFVLFSTFIIITRRPWLTTSHLRAKS